MSLRHVFWLSQARLASVLPAASLTSSWADGSTELHLSYKLSFWEMAREITSSTIQSALTFLCVGVRYAEKSPRPLTNILADRNGLAQIVDLSLIHI